MKREIEKLSDKELLDWLNASFYLGWFYAAGSSDYRRRYALELEAQNRGGEVLKEAIRLYEEAEKERARYRQGKGTLWNFMSAGEGGNK